MSAWTRQPKALEDMNEEEEHEMRQTQHDEVHQSAEDQKSVLNALKLSQECEMAAEEREAHEQLQPARKGFAH